MWEERVSSVRVWVKREGGACTLRTVFGEKIVEIISRDPKDDDEGTEEDNNEAHSCKKRVREERVFTSYNMSLNQKDLQLEP